MSLPFVVFALLLLSNGIGSALVERVQGRVPIGLLVLAGKGPLLSAIPR
jgi:hypothetical protein